MKMYMKEIITTKCWNQKVTEKYHNELNKNKTHKNNWSLPLTSPHTSHLTQTATLMQAALVCNLNSSRSSLSRTDSVCIQRLLNSAQLALLLEELCWWIVVCQHTQTTIKQRKMLHFSTDSAAGFQGSVGNFTFTLRWEWHYHTVYNLNLYRSNYIIYFLLTLVFYLSINTLTDNHSLNINED